MRFYVILHNIRSIHNVGSIFRTAEGLGADKIYLTGYTPGPHDFFGKLRKDFAKTALGAEKYIEWEKIRNVHSLIKKLRNDDVFIISLEQAKRAVSINRPALFKKGGALRKKKGIAVILGNEVRGLPKSILKKPTRQLRCGSDAIVEIPMRGKKESLNVSVAAGIALWEINRDLGT